jgi:hypothetical protein
VDRGLYGRGKENWDRGEWWTEASWTGEKLGRRYFERRERK